MYICAPAPLIGLKLEERTSKTSETSEGRNFLDCQVSSLVCTVSDSSKFFCFSWSSAWKGMKPNLNKNCLNKPLINPSCTTVLLHGPSLSQFAQYLFHSVYFLNLSSIPCDDSISKATWTFILKWPSSLAPSFLLQIIANKNETIL